MLNCRSPARSLALAIVLVELYLGQHGASIKDLVCLFPYAFIASGLLLENACDTSQNHALRGFLIMFAISVTRIGTWASVHFGVPVDAIRGLLLITALYIFGVKTVRGRQFLQPSLRTRTDLQWLSLELSIPFRVVARFIKATPRTLNWISASDELWPEAVSMLLKRARMLIVDASGVTTRKLTRALRRLPPGLYTNLNKLS